MILGPIEMKDTRSGAAYQQLAQIGIASLGDAEQMLLAAGGSKRRKTRSRSGPGNPSGSMEAVLQG